MWLARHKNVSFHYTPTHASWLSQVEIWFSILAGKSLKGVSFQAVEELRTHIDAFIKDYMKQRGLSPGPSPKSIKNTSNHVSLINDSGY